MNVKDESTVSVIGGADGICLPYLTVEENLK